MWHDVRTLNALTSALLALALLVLVASGVWWLAHRPMFTLRQVRVEAMDGDTLRHANATTIRSTAIPKIRGNFFTANLDAVRAAFEAVPWVRKAAVRREWPDRLVVEIEEHTPLATWGDEGKLVSVTGEVFTANLAEAEEEGELPALAGPEGSEKDVIARYAELSKWFAPLHLKPESVALSNRYAWTVKLDNGVSVQLGREETHSMLKERVDRLITVYPQLLTLLQNRIESVDMRYPNGLALKASGMTMGQTGKKKLSGTL